MLLTSSKFVEQKIEDKLYYVIELPIVDLKLFVDVTILLGLRILKSLLLFILNILDVLFLNDMRCMFVEQKKLQNLFRQIEMFTIIFV